DRRPRRPPRSARPAAVRPPCRAPDRGVAQPAHVLRHTAADPRPHRPAGGPMNRYAVAHLDDIDEMSDGRCPWRPVRHHFGITSFGVNTWTAREAGDRIINEHDEDEPGGHEELYLVVSGRARFELGGESVDAPAGTLVYVKPKIKRTAFAEEPNTT